MTTKAIYRVQRRPIAGMAGDAVAAASRETRLQVRNTRVAEGAIVHMRYTNRGILIQPWVVTVHT